MSETTFARPVHTPDDVAEIQTITEQVSGPSNIYAVTYTRGGVLVRHSSTHGPDPDKALRAIGYTLTRINSGLVLVTGSIDRLTLLVAERDRLNDQIAALQAETAVAA
ncbi:hypothetical protein BJF83_20635 [Nocardiopsis sp. CNR-923]|uniref:hypothetical protein n=1 Tax=Nocardiopsis sp. CNR-923 TaxID=1904965 RepID=UPI000960DF1C|nr:hypothetical protein [Nocardiopsis sp. CNR-923]OLT26573.1 hypothetical protein BJF83_20635 [Nocardiopsis sp. CNR-923]